MYYLQVVLRFFIDNTVRAQGFFIQFNECKCTHLNQIIRFLKNQV